MKIAIVHDWFTGIGGGERVVKILNHLFPKSPIYTLIYNKKSITNEYNNMEIKTTFMQKIPFVFKYYRLMLFLMPKAIESFNMEEYDLVISSSSSCAKGIIKNENSIHICYCHSPMRYAWDQQEQYLKGKNIIQKKLVQAYLKKIRKWDIDNSNRVDYFIANSENIKESIKRIYKRDAHIIYPPVDTDFFTISANKKENFYLIMSRLVPYKRIDIAIKAFNKLGKKLVIIGKGPELKKLKKIANNNIIFMGSLSDEEIRDYYQRSKAFIFPGEEDFGITPLEAQACGTPVIAFGKGGALETVVPNMTGIFFKEQTEESLIDAISYFENNQEKFKNRNKIRENALRFSNNRFKKEMIRFIREHNNINLDFHCSNK